MRKRKTRKKEKISFFFKSLSNTEKFAESLEMIDKIDRTDVL